MMQRSARRWTAAIFDRLAGILFTLVVGFAIWTYGVVAHRDELFPYPQLRAVLVYAKQGWNVIHGQIKPEAGWFFYRRPGAAVQTTRTYLPDAVSPEPVLVYGIDEDRQMSVRIIDNDGTVLHRWAVDIFSLWPDMDHVPERDRPKAHPGGEIHGLELTEDGDIVFNFEPVGLIRMDYCGAPKWRLPAFTHHAVNRGAGGGFIVPEQEYVEDPTRRDKAGNLEVFHEYVTFVGADGRIEERISVNDLLLANGLQGLYYLGEHAPFGLHVADNDVLHLNDVEAFPAGMAPGVFGPGDILISLRNLNTVIVFERASRKVKYVHTGSFVMQHDPDFISGNEISLVDNHSVVPSNMDRPTRPEGVSSRIVILDARDNSERVFFAGGDRVPFFTDIMGKHQWLPNGNLLVTEARWGRVFELSPKAELVWEYNNILKGGSASGLLGMVIGAFRLPPGMDRAKLESLAKGCANG